MSEVSLLKQKKDSISDTIQKCLELIEFNYNKDAHNILIKPNMCYYWDSTTGHTTDPLFVEEIVKILRTKYSNDVDISVIESDASAMKCKYAFKMLGYEKMSERNKINLFNLSEMEKEKNSVTVNDKLYEFDIPIIIKNADLLINIPKIKYMNSNIKMTCALKNIFGCNPNHKKYIYHKDINEVIVALNKLIKTDLCIVDGIVVHGIKTKKIDLIMASKDPVAIDTAAAKIIGVNPKYY